MQMESFFQKNQCSALILIKDSSTFTQIQLSPVFSQIMILGTIFLLL